MRQLLLSLLLLAACSYDTALPTLADAAVVVAADADVHVDAGAPDARLCNPYTRGLLIGDGITASMVTTVQPYLQNTRNSYAFSLAADGNTIANQLAAWRASPYRGDLTISWIYVNIGMEDVVQGADATTTTANMGALLADMHASNPGTKVLVETLFPARTRLEQVVDPPRYPVWVKVNEELVAQFAGDSSLADPLNDGTDALKAQYDSGNKITPNQAGASVVASKLGAWVTATFPMEACKLI
jgi:hypothetical protein